MTLRSLPSSAVHTAQQSRSPERSPDQHAGRELPAGDLPAAPPGASGKEDTPVFWQTLQAMASTPGQPDGPPYWIPGRG
jgi:hypothetical protein